MNRSDLERLLQTMRAQREEFLTKLHQANGAIQILEHLLTLSPNEHGAEEQPAPIPEHKE